LFALQTTENLATRRAGFAANKAHSDDEVIWDDGEEDNDASSNAAAEGSSATYGDDGSEELEDSSEPLSHSSKSPGPSSLRDWSEDDDDEPEPTAALGATALHVAAAAASRTKDGPIVEVPDSPEQPAAAPDPVALEPTAPAGARSEVIATKKSSRPAPPELALKRKRMEPAARGLLPPKAKKVVKCQATAVIG
jgi:hypothetical protein